MKRILSLLLVLCLLFMTPGFMFAEEELSVIGTNETPVRPGSAVIVSFTSPGEGTAAIRVTDDDGAILCVITENYTAHAGRNDLYWNGTWQGISAPAGSWNLTVSMDGQEASYPIEIADPAPVLSQIDRDTEALSPGGSMTVTCVASTAGTLTLSRMGDEGTSVLTSAETQGGEASVSWDGSFPDGETHDGLYNLMLMLTDRTGMVSEITYLETALIGFDAAAAEEAGEDPVSAVLLPAEEDLLIEETLPEDETDAEEASSVITAVSQSDFTPSYGSPYSDYSGADPYWSTPMDITDTEAIWNMLTAPITVIDNGKKNGEKVQILLRSEPDASSRPAGVVTCITQGVRVIREEGEWTLVECYSSSFHDTSCEAWNMLVQGWVLSKYIKTTKPSTKRGIVIDKLTQRLYIFQDGELYDTLLCSTGLANERQPYNETRSGEFLLTSAVGRFNSDNLYCAMAIRFNNGDLLHEVPYTLYRDGSKNYKNCQAKLGIKASHGCIRVQRHKTSKGINMEWLWNNRIKNTKIVIWEDWQGRQIQIPDGNTELYYNPNKGELYHSAATCYSAKGKTFTPFLYSQLEDEEFASLTRCDYCNPPLRVSEIEAINAVYAPGGDHDPVMTAARQKYLDSIED